MIRYSLKCTDQHAFDSWFQSATAFDTLLAAGQVECPACGSIKVEKMLMAPNLAQTAPLSAPQNDMEKAVAELRRKVEENADYVGVNFVAEARMMHEGLLPERSIYGEARPEEAIKLLADGIPVAPLPFVPARKTN